MAGGAPHAWHRALVRRARAGREGARPLRRERTSHRRDRPRSAADLRHRFCEVRRRTEAMTSLSIVSGLADGAWRRSTSPLALTRNLVKFHLIRAVPSSPRRALVSSRYSGCAALPLTSIFANSGNVTP